MGKGEELVLNADRRWADDFQTAVGTDWTWNAKNRVQWKILGRTLVKRSAVKCYSSKVTNDENNVV